MNRIKTILLAGGIGKRFWPLTTSKVLLPFFGKPLIQYTIEHLIATGFTDIIVVTNEADKNAIETMKVSGAKISTVVQKEALGMGDAVLLCQPFIGNDPCVIMNALDQFDESFYRDVQKKIMDHASFVVAKKSERYFDGGYFKTNGDTISGIVEKPGEGNEPGNLVNIVFHYFQKPEGFLTVLSKTKSDNDDTYEKALNTYVSAHPVSYIVYDGAWQPVKYPWHILDVMDLLGKANPSEYKGTNVQLKPGVIIEGPVYLGKNVKIFEHTKIVGPCYIGNNSIIGNNNIIRHSIIGSDSVTGFNTDITRSYIGNNCWFHSNYIGDSVLEENVSLGSGTVLANLRLDEGEIASTVRDKRLTTNRNKLGAMIGRDVRIGVNSSIMPGVKIGKNSFIGAGVVLNRDLPENIFCMVKQTTEIGTNQKKVAISRDKFRKKL